MSSRTWGGAGTLKQPSLGRVLGHVERRVARRVEAVLSVRGLAVDQWRVLDLLADGEGRPMSALAGAIVVPGPTLTKIIDKLVDGALVYRLVDEHDRRRVLAFISPKGKKLHAELAQTVADAEADAIGVLGDESAALLELLIRVAEDESRGASRD